MNMRRYLWAVSTALGVLILAKGVVPVFTSPGFSYGQVFQHVFRLQTTDTIGWTVKCSSEKSTAPESACDKAMPNITGEWVSDHQKVGASIEVQFPVEVELAGVHLFDRGDAKETIQDGHFEFFNGTRYPDVGGIAVLANPAFPNAIATFPAPVRTVGFKFIVDSVSSTTTAAGLAEIAPVFTTLADAKSRPRRIVGTFGTSTNDVDGVLPLVRVSSSMEQPVVKNLSDAAGESGTFSIASQSLSCHWGGQERPDGTAVLPNGDHRFLCRNGIWWVHGGSASGYGGVQTGDLAQCPSGEFCFTIVPVCTISSPWYLSASTKLWEALRLGPNDPSCSISPPIHLQVSVPSSRPLAQQFTSGMNNTVWMQYKLTAPDEDVVIRSIPIAFAFEHILVPNDASLVPTLPISHIRLYASADASMVNKIQIGPTGGVALGVGGKALMKFDQHPFTVTKAQPVYVTIEADIAQINLAHIASLGFGDSNGSAQEWVLLGSDPSDGSYGIQAESVSKKQVIDPTTITSTGETSGTIASSADHQLYGSAIEVKESVTPPLPTFAGGIVDEPVFQFSLQSRSGGVGIKRMEFVGSGTCNGNMGDRGNAKLFDVTGTGATLIAQWNNQPISDLVYSTYDHVSVSIPSGKIKVFQLQVTTNCSGGQTLQYAIGGAHSYTGTRATISGIQWFAPAWGASKSIDSPTTRGLPLVGSVLTAQRADAPPDRSTDTSGLVEVAPGNVLLCTTPEADRLSYPFEVIRLAMLPDNPPPVGAASNMLVRLKNRFDIAQLYTITVDWGDGNTDVYTASRALKGQSLIEVPIAHTYTQTRVTGFPIRVRVHSGDRAIASALWDCSVVPTTPMIDTVIPPSDTPPLIHETPPTIDDRNHPIDPVPPTVVNAGLSLRAGNHESFGMIFGGTQEIGSFTLAMSGENRSSNSLRIWSAGEGERYTTINQSNYTVAVTATGISVAFTTPVKAQYLKIQVVVAPQNTHGVTIANPATALEVYSPYGMQ